MSSKVYKTQTTAGQRISGKSRQGCNATLEEMPV